MIYRILLGLDPDDDTRTATQYAVEIGKRFEAQITGLAVVDTEHIESESMGSGIGSMHYASKLRDKMLEEAREIAASLTEDFVKTIRSEGIEAGELVEEGVPFRRIIDEMISHDLLVLGKEPHFFYNKPERKTSTLSQVVKNCAAPILVVPENYRPTRRVMMAFDGHDPSTRAIRFFLALQPFGSDLELDIVYVDSNPEENDVDEQKVHLLGALVASHGFNTNVTILKDGNVTDRLIEHAEVTKADLIVAGAHAVSSLRAFAFGSTTKELLERCPIAVFLYR